MVDLDLGRPHAPITVAIPTHPARGYVQDPSTLLGRVVVSVRAQTLQPLGGISIACDLDGDGAAVTRQRALDAVETEWVSFLDSDDYWYQHHLETHWRLITNGGAGYPDATSVDGYADVAYSWWGGNRPFPEETHRGLAFDPAHPHHITMTLTVRTSLAKAVGFLGDPLHPDWAGEDWRFILGLCELGAKFVGTGEETWFYDASHGGNTSGHPGRGDGPAAVPIR
jgi:hypothetical protein